MLEDILKRIKYKSPVTYEQIKDLPNVFTDPEQQIHVAEFIERNIESKNMMHVASTLKSATTSSKFYEISNFLEKNIDREEVITFSDDFFNMLKDYPDEKIQKYIDFWDRNIEIDGLKNVAHAIADTIRHGSISSVANVMEYFENYKGVSPIEAVALPIGAPALCLKDAIPQDKLLKFLKKYSDKDLVPAAVTIFNTTLGAKSVDVAKAVIDIFDEYIDQSSAIARAYERIPKENLKKAYHSQLLSDKAKDAVLKSRNPEQLVYNLLTRNYSPDLIDSIKDKISYEDLDLVYDTVALIKEIHQKRNPNHRLWLIGSFYQELNRAINQGNSYRAKIGNLRQYCREVQKEMKQNIEDLMVVTNA